MAETTPKKNTTLKWKTKPSLWTPEEEKDLGVIITPDLKFSQHVAKIAKKANLMIELVRTSFRFMDGKMFVLLYKALIWSHLEYCHAVWNPINKTDADLLERTQRRATKIVPELKRSALPRKTQNTQITKFKLQTKNRGNDYVL